MGPVGGPSSSELAPRAQVGHELKRDLLTDDEAARFASARLDWVGDAARATAEKAERLSVLLEGQQALLSATPSRRPSRGYVTSGYGMRIDPFTGLAQLHTGIDFSASIGAPANASADGVVIFAGTHGAHGKMVEIDHGHGLVTRYGHLSKMHVKVGESVKRGQPIGDIGNTGRSTGPHLHYEIRLNGIPQDPRRFMLE
jgi:murein DD-endopeptidase MepM/ murein hydrolase activator NlpD